MIPRLFFVLTIAACAALSLETRAVASEPERCIAEVALGAVGVHDDYVLGPAHQFAFVLSAHTSRAVSGTLALDTDHGWFVAPFNDVQIAGVQRHFQSENGTYAQEVWRSRVLYVDVGQNVTVNHFLLDDLVTADASAPKVSRCYDTTHLEAPKASARKPNTRWEGRILDGEDLAAPPAANATVIPGMKSAPLASATCAQPFINSTATSVYTPEFPQDAIDRGFGRSTALIELRLDASGAVSGAWILHSSGISDFDYDALRGAQSSKYTPTIAYCTAIPSLYIFAATFDPNR